MKLNPLHYSFSRLPSKMPNSSKNYPKPLYFPSFILYLWDHIILIVQPLPLWCAYAIWFVRIN